MRYLHIFVFALTLATAIVGYCETIHSAQTQNLIQLLGESITLKDVPPSANFPGLLEFLNEKLAARGKVLPIFVNTEEFKKACKQPQSMLKGELPIQLPASPPQLTVEVLLKHVLSQEETVETTFLIRNGMIEILPAEFATTEYLLKRRYCAAFQRLPLADVIEEISYKSGATIVLDPQTGDKAKMQISVILRNDVTLKAALEIITEMADLRVCEINGGLFVTTPERAKTIGIAAKQPPWPGQK